MTLVFGSPEANALAKKMANEKKAADLYAELKQARDERDDADDEIMQIERDEERGGVRDDELKAERAEDMRRAQSKIIALHFQLEELGYTPTEAKRVYELLDAGEGVTNS